jgi:hypothetical protein
MLKLTHLDRALAYEAAFPAREIAQPCNCIGPQNGAPLCPCQMRGVTIKDGRYVRPEQDLGPAPTTGRVIDAAVQDGAQASGTE